MKHLPFARPLLKAVGVLAAAALVWFVGPLVAIAGVVPLAAEPARWAAIAGLATLVAAHAAWRAMQAARANRGLLQGMVAATAASTPPAPGAKDVAVIERRFEQAIALLRDSRIGGKRRWVAALTGQPYVHELPWYVIVGAPGAGKTTALVNSGLQFPLADAVGQKAIRGIAGTRHCDWWFASDAVLIDTAGRYTTHESDREADRAAWLGFLALLARYRPRRPINGVLLTLSASELLGASAERRLAHANELRERIEELHSHLGIAFPVYVLVTKSDLLAGFMEFFADFDRDERAQVWGVTFPHQADSTRDGPRVRMASDFAALEKRLNDCLLDRLHDERDRERRAAIYTFPQQWGLLRQTLYDFLQTMLGGMAAELRPMVRGVYFTSATQEGTPMDRALGGLARALGLPSRVISAARPSGKSFFVTRLLRDVVFAEAGLAGTNLRWARRRAALEGTLAAATVCALVVLGGMAWRTHADSRSHLAALSGRMPALQRDVDAARVAPPTDLLALLPVLDSLAGMAASGEAAPRLLPAAFRTGLDRGDMVHAAAGDAYRLALREAFLPRIAARLEQRLRDGAAGPIARTYEALKAYLMLFGGRHYDAAALRAYLRADWDASLPAGLRAEQREALGRHLDRLLASGEVGAPSHADARVVASARSRVAGVPMAQRVYDRLKQLDLGAQAQPFAPAFAAGPHAQRVFARASGRPLTQGVPALYSRTVWRQSLRERTQEVMDQLAREQPWVLGVTAPAGGPGERAALTQEVQRLYLAEYAARWGELIDDLRLAPTADLPATAQLAHRLARPDSPLLAVLRAMVREVAVGVPVASPPGAADEAGPDGVLAPRFEALQAFLAAKPAPADDMQALLGRLASHLDAVESAARRKTLPPASDVIHELQLFAQRAPEPVRGMLAQLAQASGAQAFAALREPLARQLASDVAGACRAVAGRYPLARASRDEASREDFTRAFGTGGAIDGFFQRHLAPYVDTSTRPWTYRAAANPGGAESLRQFQRARTLREAFFRPGGQGLGVRLDLRLVGLDTGVSEFTLDVDGQVLRFRPGVPSVQTLQWPGPQGSGRVRVRILPSAGAAGPGYVFDGPWALLRLFDRVRIESGASADRVQLVFDVEGRKARFEVASQAPLGPVLRGDPEEFQCPTRL